MKSRIHMTLQGKGGVGKSFVASLIAQHQMAKRPRVSCIDTDPVNHTFFQYKSFGTKQIEILEGARINERRFDDLMEMILSEDCDFVIDNGASSFIPISSYLVENRAIETLVEAGKSIIVHSVITGGQALNETLSALDRVATQFSAEAEIVVWLNEYFGEIRKSGRDFEEMRVYKENVNRISGVVRIPRQSEDTFGKDIEKMLNLKMTFDEAMESGEFRFMAKKRLKIVKENLFSQMDLVFDGQAYSERGAA